MVRQRGGTGGDSIVREFFIYEEHQGQKYKYLKRCAGILKDGTARFDISATRRNASPREPQDPRSIDLDV